MNEWGAKYFVSTINPLLTDYLPTFGISSFNDNMIEKCIEVSGVIPSIVESVPEC